MLQRQTSGSVVCPSCGRLVGVRDDKCWNCGRRNPGMWGFAPAIRALGQDLGFGKIAIGICLLIYAIALVGFPDQISNYGILGLLSPGTMPQFLLGAAGSVPVFGEGRWWTVASACWLHGGLLHIGFNMYWLYQLSPAVSHLFGPGRATLIYLGSSVVGFTATSVAGLLPFLPSFLRGATFTVGASAAIFGWLGALAHYGRRSGNRRMSQQMLGFALPLFVMGLLMPMVDNWAHLGGFAGGYVLSMWLDPLKPERLDHLVAAMVALLLSLGAVVASVILGLPYLR